MTAAAREEILARIRASLADVPAGERPEDVAVGRAYRRVGDGDPGVLRERLRERLEEYGAGVSLAAVVDVAATVAELCRRHGLRRVAFPPQLEPAWIPRGVELVPDHDLDVGALDAVDVALTGCAVAVAQTGTIMLDGGAGSGRRALTLVPDHHICVVAAAQIVDLVPEGLSRIASAVTGRRAPVTLISGPSATSDIELSRVVGVHGPRRLDVIITATDAKG